MSISLHVLQLGREKTLDMQEDKYLFFQEHLFEKLYVYSFFMKIF